jgi:hypothetical protein
MNLLVSIATLPLLYHYIFGENQRDTKTLIRMLGTLSEELSNTVCTEYTATETCQEGVAPFQQRSNLTSGNYSRIKQSTELSCGNILVQKSSEILHTLPSGIKSSCDWFPFVRSSFSSATRGHTATRMASSPTQLDN